MKKGHAFKRPAKKIGEGVDVKKSLRIFVTIVFISPFVMATLAMAKSLKVITINHSNQDFAATEQISKGGTKHFTLTSYSNVDKIIVEPSSGTVKLSAYFVGIPSVPVLNCSSIYDVATAASAVVSVYVSSGTVGHCNVTIR
jgi:hypothetical protein